MLDIINYRFQIRKKLCHYSILQKRKFFFSTCEKSSASCQTKKKKIPSHRDLNRHFCRLRHLLSSPSFINMGRGERDIVDTSLIVTEPRVPRPTARARGLHLQEGLSAPNVPEKAKGYLSMPQIKWHCDLPWPCRPQASCKACHQRGFREKTWVSFDVTETQKLINRWRTHDKYLVSEGCVKAWRGSV